MTELTKGQGPGELTPERLMEIDAELHDAGFVDCMGIATEEELEAWIEYTSDCRNRVLVSYCSTAALMAWPAIKVGRIAFSPQSQAQEYLLVFSVLLVVLGFAGIVSRGCLLFFRKRVAQDAISRTKQQENFDV